MVIEQPESLPLLIASGVLLAALAMFGVRCSFAFARREEWAAAFWVGAASCLFGGTLILAGLGFISW